VPEAASPYAPPKATLEDAAPPPVELAARSARLGAAVIDTVALGGAAFFGALFHPAGLFAGMAAVGAINLWTLHRARASLGKLALSLRVVRTDGTEAELWRIVLLRWLPTGLIGFIPGLNLLNLVDVLFIFRGDRRCVHDLIADTVVIDSK
jgi:uncharacterized RDD family membrane protein YckC